MDGRIDAGWIAVLSLVLAVLSSLAAGLNPSSAVQKARRLAGCDLRDLGADFRHYIRDFARALRQTQAEMGEQLRGGG